MGDHGSRQPRPARLAGGVRARRSRGRSRRDGDARALERLRAIVAAVHAPPRRRTPPRSSSSCRRSRSRRSTAASPSSRRASTAPRSTAGCRASRSTSDSFGRRGAVLAMLGQLKQVCNHPEMRRRRPGGRSTAARASSSGSSSCSRPCRPTTRRSSSPSTPASTGSCRTCERTARPRGRLLPRRPDRAGSATSWSHAFVPAGRPRRCSSISIRAGGRGLNLPAANHVFHFDRWWNPAVEQQATDRAYRLRPAQARLRPQPHLHRRRSRSGSTQLLDSKRELAEKVIAGHAPTTGSASSTSTRSARPSRSRPRRSEEAA